jgi:hypothetical protein
MVARDDGVVAGVAAEKLPSDAMVPVSTVPAPSDVKKPHGTFVEVEITIWLPIT